jgi:ABC-type phosphate transport system substrate-binding protein
VNRRFRNLSLAILVGALLAAAAATAVYATDFAVIVHPSNPAKTMSLADFGKILRIKTPNWPNGRVITVVMRDPNQPEMKFAVEKILGVSFEEGKALLVAENHKPASTLIFVPTDEDVVKAVENNPTAIGIVDVYNITSAVKVIRIDDKQPFDPGYVLKGH